MRGGVAPAAATDRKRTRMSGSQLWGPPMLLVRARSVRAQGGVRSLYWAAQRTEPRVSPLPLPIRLMNRAGSALRAVGVARPRLDEASLLDAARRRTGLGEFGDASFREPLGRLLDSLEADAALTTLGRVIARTEIVSLLANRLQMEDWWRRHPEIGEERIERPVFVIGMGRTGTTILHDLLAQDSANRVPSSWEVARPCPPPEASSRDTDPRIAEVDALLAQTDRLIPGFKSMHPMGARLPQECVAITAHDFTSMIHHTSYRVPSYAAWLHGEAELGPVYANHRRMLQLLQWRCPGERWVLKSPGHLWALEDVMREYPDAVFVQTHRDPLRVVASLTSLVALLRTMTSERVDTREVAREWTAHIATALDRSVEAREKGRIPAERIVDLQFRDFLADPFAAIQRIYDGFSLDYTGEADRRMRAFLAANPSDRHGTHRYRFADTGLSVDEERERYRRYQMYFDVPSEDLD